MRSSRQLESLSVLLYQRHFILSSLSASIEWTTLVCHSRFTQLVPILFSPIGSKVLWVNRHPDLGEDGQLFALVRLTLADILLCYDELPSLLTRPIARCTGMLYLFFQWRIPQQSSSRRSGSVIVRLYVPTYAARVCGYRAWPTACRYH